MEIFLSLIIVPGIKEVNCSDAWKFAARHCENVSSSIQGIYFYQSYIPGALDD